jgi:hypothetical protein
LNYKSSFALSTAFLLSLSALPARAASPDANLTINISGTLDPKISGSDPAGAAGHAGALVITASESLRPTKKTKTSVTYTLPKGAVKATVAGSTYKTTKPSTMTIKIPAKGSDEIILKGTVTIDSITATIVGTVQLANGSYSKSILSHPTTFSPSPQNLTAATTKTGPGSKVQYTVLGGATLLGLSGTASN